MAETDKWRNLVASWPVARLATVREDGRPRVVPCCFALDGDALYTAVDSKPKRTRRLGRLDDIRVNPAVSLVVDHYAEDWTQLWWARLDGRATVLDDGPEWQRAVDLLRAKYAQYQQYPPEGAVIAVRIEGWKTWSWSGIEPRRET